MIIILMHHIMFFLAAIIMVINTNEAQIVSGFLLGFGLGLLTWTSILLFIDQTFLPKMKSIDQHTQKYVKSVMSNHSVLILDGVCLLIASFTTHNIFTIAIFVFLFHSYVSYNYIQRKID